ncbi:hypothetical protein [Muribaculum intestinale]|nr:hypothetical protein [Muribaculum intestinale]MYM12834.1 hypothetical protein [Muribaculum intestinale]
MTDYTNPCNGDTENDIRMDFDYNENTGELSDIFDEVDMDEYVNNLDDWD